MRPCPPSTMQLHHKKPQFSGFQINLSKTSRHADERDCFSHWDVLAQRNQSRKVVVPNLSVLTSMWPTVYRSFFLALSLDKLHAKFNRSSLLAVPENALCFLPQSLDFERWDDTSGVWSTEVDLGFCKSSAKDASCHSPSLQSSMLFQTRQCCLCFVWFISHGGRANLSSQVVFHFVTEPVCWPSTANLVNHVCPKTRLFDTICEQPVLLYMSSFRENLMIVHAKRFRQHQNTWYFRKVSACPSLSLLAVVGWADVWTFSHSCGGDSSRWICFLAPHRVELSASLRVQPTCIYSIKGWILQIDGLYAQE